MNEDERRLDLLAIFHFILGGLAGLGACMPLIHIAIGLTMIFAGGSADEAAPALMGLLFAGLGFIAIVLGGIWAALLIIAGMKLKARTARTFCLVIAGLECLMVPLGTILGVLTIVFLTKDSVVAMFEGGT